MSSLFCVCPLFTTPPCLPQCFVCLFYHPNMSSLFCVCPLFTTPPRLPQCFVCLFYHPNMCSLFCVCPLFATSPCLVPPLHVCPLLFGATPLFSQPSHRSLSSVLSIVPFWAFFLQLLHITKPLKYVAKSIYSLLMFTVLLILSIHCFVSSHFCCYC